jgi:ATP-dependent Clp protease ATP-binding subunit ClpA
LDKFLQVLDDGVLTSGRGDRVYFSEAFIVFTSNLGIYRLDAEGNRVPNVSPDNEYAEVQAKVRAEIENHFKLALNRPEILNRIGDNLVVFDFIRPGIAAEIFIGIVDAAISEISANQRIEVGLSEESRNRLRDLCLADLSNGGRGIRNKVEKHFLNPLARSLFDSNAAEGDKYRVTAVEAGTVTTLTLAHLPS